MRKMIVCVVLVLFVLTFIESADARKETPFEYGKTYSSSSWIQVNLVGQRGDNFTINVSCPTGIFAFDVMSGGSSIGYINSSNDTLMDHQNMASSVDLWFILSNEQTITMQIIPNGGPLIYYSITRVNATDPIEARLQNIESNITSLSEQISNITIENITNITEVHIHNETYLNITDSALMNQTIANLTLLEGQTRELQYALANLSIGNRTIYTNTTVVERWDELNSTLGNITQLQSRIAREENRTIPTAYNDSGLLRRVSQLEDRNSTNTVIFNNRTTTIEKNDVTIAVLSGVIAGTGTAIGGVILSRPSRRKGGPDSESRQ